MESEKQNYLNKLYEWGEDTKKTVRESAITDDEKEKWEDDIAAWQNQITDQLQRENAISFDDMRGLQQDGEQIAQEIEQKNDQSRQSSVGYGNHQLPPLPYAYDALEPYISEEIMRLHHDEHHQSYVDGLNQAERALYIDNAEGDIIKHWLREQAFHGSGHMLHSIFWTNMTPDSPGRPVGQIAARIDADFGSWNEFKRLFTDVASSVEGVGWAILFWNPETRKLGVQSFEKHQQFQIANVIPLLVLDVWEHAYYLQYQTDTDSYIDNWWNVVNWQDVNNRFTDAL